MTLASHPATRDGKASVWHRLSYWVLAMRPRTLPIAASPVLVGTTLAWQADAKLNIGTFAVTLLSALLIQTGTNLHNDAADGERGLDGPARRGPPRATQMGWLRAGQVRAAAYACFALAALAGLHLVAVGGWPILALGVLSLGCGLAYSAGPMPISYTPLGEIFVLAFFGLGAVCGTYFLQTGELTTAAVLAGTMLGLQAAAVLHLNNMRDADGDAAAGRRTLAIVSGRRVSNAVYAALVLLPYALLVALRLGDALIPATALWLPMLSLPATVAMTRRAYGAETASEFNGLLAGTAQLEAAFALLMCIALVV